jgi:hypothetical protein
MRYAAAISLTMALAALGGCKAEVSQTDDSTKVEVEGPKVEVGEKTPDLDPRTDHDVDVDTPLPGDK